MLLVSTGAVAQTVEITATRDRARQLDTAAITVVGRDELLRYGDQSVADALKRLPGITVSGVQGRGGDIRMRGLGNGYMQVLLNGQPVPSRFSIDSVAPELIERVEGVRVASAELGTQAIAGTINIVLRKSAPVAQRDVKLGLAASNGEHTPDIAVQISGTGAGWAYTVPVVAVGAKTRTTTAGEESGFDGTGALNLRRRTDIGQMDVRPSINLTSRISWTLPNGDTLSSQNFIRMMTLDLPTVSSERTTVGAPTRFPDNDTVFRAHAETVRSDLQWLTIDRVGQVGTTWISTPVNAGRAYTWGIELEAKFPLQAIVPAAPALDLRANVARNWSRVDSVPRPDIRLSSQVPLNAGVGLDLRMAALPVTMGASFNFQGGGPARLSERSTGWTGVQRELGMYALRRVDARSAWRMSAANMLGQDNRSEASFVDVSGTLRTATTAPTAATVRLAFEHMFD